MKRVKEPELAQRLDIDIEVAKKLITRLLSERYEISMYNGVCDMHEVCISQHNHSKLF